MAESRTHQIFRSRVEMIETYLEAMDAAARVAYNSLRNQNNRGRTIGYALPINCDKYRRLNHPVSHKDRIFNFCKAHNCENAIIDVFSAFSEYMYGILHEMYNNNPMAVVNKSNKTLNMTFSEIAKLGNFEAIKNKMIDDVFRALENERSTITLINKIIRDTNVNITDADKDKVLPYLEMRHLLIHNNKKIDRKFEDKYGNEFGLKQGNKVPTNFDNASKALAEVTTFVGKLDAELIRLDHIPKI